MNDDWLDPSVLRRYDELLAEPGDGCRLYWNDADYGQVAFLAALSASEKAAFDKLSKVKLRPIARRA